MLRRIISRVDRLVSSIAQDLICNSTNGRSKTVRHVELALNIKRRTGNKAVITWLNRNGHCISYTDVGLVETKFVDDQVQLCSSSGYVPSVMQPSVPVIFVWDNGDHNPESVHGVSLHCTNGIMRKLQEDRPSPVASTDVIVTDNTENTITESRTRKRRSFQPVQSVIKPYTGDKRQNPTVIRALETSSNELTSTLSAMVDQIWCLARLHSWTTTGTKKIQNWPGFNYLIHLVEHTDDVHTVSYLPSINQSPTRMDTVLEVLKVTVQKFKKLFLEEVDIVFDHAIYSKALEIIMNPIHEDLRAFCNIAWGHFTQSWHSLLLLAYDLEKADYKI